MAAESTTVERVRLLIRDALNVDVPDGDTDLLTSGLLDSLGLVTLIVEIEQEFEVEVPLDDFDPDRFRSVERIAAFLMEAYPTPP
jgi:D-alanine--poly(phosphoribitol) ligase subunit 2